MQGNRDREYTEIKTSELAQVEAFLRQNADKLESHQIVVRRANNLFVAECFSAEEPPI
jgi:hypothetical protein